MTIRKGTFTFTFMFDDNIDSEEAVRAYSVEDIIGECDTGHFLGRPSSVTIVEVPNENVVAEELAMGCDGTFFADPDELAHARMDAEDE